MATEKSSAPHVHPSTEDQDPRDHDHHDEHDLRDHDTQDQDQPHACYQGVVFIGRLVVGDDGEEVEVFESVSCRRCAEDK